jgi:predicted NBD/HSP70 family sugar kinase
MLKVPAILDPGFAPLSVMLRDYAEDVKKYGKSSRFVCSIERSHGYRTAWEMEVFPDGVEDDRTATLFERVVKGMVWLYGGFRVRIAGSKAIYDRVADAFRDGGARDFDFHYMERVYEQPFEVLYYEDPEEIAQSIESPSNIGRHYDGCRIGFDAGGSDRKVSAVIDGEAVYSEEVVWHPKITEDPDYHYQHILEAMKTAASHMPRVDAIGVSSAGIYIDNKTMAASLFLAVPPELHESKVKYIYPNVAKEIGDVPLVVCNDGDVTALAGAIGMEVGNVLGIAMGTSEAGGYVDENMHIMGWLNELAFVPIDANPDAMVDEWSGDYGCGVKYFSQDGVIKLAPRAGIELDESLSPAEKLKVVQKEMENGNPEAAKIYETIGVNFGYAIAYYSLFYHIEHVLIMGRVTSGEGGVLLIKKAQEVLDTEFPELAKQIKLNIPDEKTRRVGQSAAAASLPYIEK